MIILRYYSELISSYIKFIPVIDFLVSDPWNFVWNTQKKILQ